MPENHPKYQERLLSLRKEMKKQGLSGLIIPRTDAFQGEFLAPYAETVQWLSGFTGSAGVCIILQDKAVVMSDGRYTIQLKDQVPSDLYDTGNSVDVSVGQWLSDNAQRGDVIGYDAWLHTAKQVSKIEEALTEAGLNLEVVQHDPIERVWSGRPEKPNARVSVFPDDIAGLTSYQKRRNIAEKLEEQGCDSCLMTLGDSICWLLNVRGGDIEYSPLILSYGVLHRDGSFDWFVDKDKVGADIRAHVGQGVHIHDIGSMQDALEKITGRVWLDSTSAPIWFQNLFLSQDVALFDMEDPCILPKSLKTVSEIKAIRQAHVHDGVAMVKFLKWFDEAVNEEGMDELSVEGKLDDFRKECPDYLGPSFSTIAGFNANGAIVHYRATAESATTIKGDGLLLIDSGGQYRWGTTDITRTIAVGVPSDDMKDHYTRVLKGHIALASARFDAGTIGKEIDAVARKPLHDVGLDYAHGTGHGVGCYLCVHETAANISPKGQRAFDKGMLISNEPGYYKEGAYGIRIETLVLVDECPKSKEFCFDTMTLAPYDPRLIKVEILSSDEMEWLNRYSENLMAQLCDELDVEHSAWLKKRLSMFL